MFFWEKPVEFAIDDAGQFAERLHRVVVGRRKTAADVEQVHLGVATVLRFLEDIGGEVNGRDVVLEIGRLAADVEADAFHGQPHFVRRENRNPPLRRATAPNWMTTRPSRRYWAPSAAMPDRPAAEGAQYRRDGRVVIQVRRVARRSGGFDSRGGQSGADRGRHQLRNSETTNYKLRRGHQPRRHIFKEEDRGYTKMNLLDITAVFRRPTTTRKPFRELASTESRTQPAFPKKHPDPRRAGPAFAPPPQPQSPKYGKAMRESNFATTSMTASITPSPVHRRPLQLSHEIVQARPNPDLLFRTDVRRAGRGLAGGGTAGRRQPGDLLYSEQIGAYSHASSTWFNGFPPATVVHINQ